MSKIIKENSVVILKDGTTGTILFCYGDSNFLFECEDSIEQYKQYNISENEIEKVLWEP